MPTLFRFLTLAAVIAVLLPAAQAGQLKPINAYGAYNADAPSDWRRLAAFDTGPATSLDTLVNQLSAAIDRISRHRIPKDPPVVRRISHAELESYVCETNCAIKAWYKPGEGIFLDETLKPETNVFDRSILLHELVHYFQDKSGYYRDANPCDRWLQRELDAYDIQNRYLMAIGHPRRVAYAGNNCHVQASGQDGILRRQVFDGTVRATDMED
jgi:hypothetical protein